MVSNSLDVPCILKSFRSRFTRSFVTMEDKIPNIAAMAPGEMPALIRIQTLYSLSSKSWLCLVISSEKLGYKPKRASCSSCHSDLVGSPPVLASLVIRLYIAEELNCLCAASRIVFSFWSIAFLTIICSRISFSFSRINSWFCS